VIVEDPKPFPDGEYYSVSASMDCDTHDLGHLTYLIPVELLHIPPRPVQSGWGDTTAAEESPQPQQRTEKAVEQEEEKSQEIPAKKEKSPAQPGVSATVTQERVKEPVVAVVYKDSSMAEAYIEALRECGHTPVALAANQSFNSLRQNQVCGALLIIDRVDDDAFALMIKIRSETPAQQPLIVAGPDWTRSAVLKAVKYGVTDIIPTPATAAEIREKVEHNLKNSC
jgi:PleD family two-component response regulator